MGKHHHEEKKDKEETTHTTLAVKYRPKTLDKVVGQDGVVKIIRGAISTGKMPRTIMIVGPFGCGKTTLARLILRYVNCKGDGPDNGCKCESCKAWLKDEHPDIHEKDAGDLRGIDDIRELKKVISFLPRYKRRGYILDECHALTKDAWNAALKTFEEPPARSMFILCTTDPHKIPDTIQSRSLVLSLNAIGEADLVSLVRHVCKKEGIEDFPKDAAKMIAESAAGHPRNALSLLEQVLLYMESEDLDLKDKKNIKEIKKQLPEIAKTVLKMPEQTAVIKYMAALLDKNYDGAFRILPEVNNAPVFLGMVTKLITQHLYSITAKSVMDGRYARLVDSNSSSMKKYWSERRLGEMLGLALETYERAKQYVVPERECLDLFTVKAIGLGR